MTSTRSGAIRPIDAHWFGILLAALCCGAAWLRVELVRGAEISAELQELRVQRREAAARTRRLIFNNDGNEPVYLCRNDSPEELLSHRTAPLAGTQVNSIFYCTWSSGFGLFTHRTQVGHLFDTREGRFSTNRITSMLAAGTDPLQVMTDFAQRNQMELFWSYRLNDTHDASTADYGPVMFRANQFKQQHPEWLIGSPQQKPKFGGWSAVDFSEPEIRRLAVAYAAEVCRNYNVDGIEIDFFRHPVFFRRPAQTGTVASDQERAWMTDVVRQIRDLTESEGLRRQRPILLAIRVPDSVEYCRDIGLDLSGWLKDGLVDLLVVSGYFQLNTWETSVALGRQHGVRVYASLDESRVSDAQSKSLRTTVESYRGRALNAWHAGVDGVYLFNAFDPRNPIWNELASPEKLHRLDHDYFASVRGVGAAAGGALPHAKYQKIPTLNPAKPLQLTAGQSQQVDIWLGLLPGEPGQAGVPEANSVLRCRFSGLASPETVAVSFEGQKLTLLSQQGDWCSYQVPSGLRHAGRHRVAVELAAAGPSSPPNPRTSTPQTPVGQRVAAASAVNWTDLHVSVRFAAPISDKARQ